MSERVDDASVILVLSPPCEQCANAACLDLLTVADPRHEAVLSVTVTPTADDRLELWNTYIDHWPAKLGIITIEELTQSATVSLGPQPYPTESLDFETISDPTDLAELGITISTMVSAWADREQQVVACFHSLTPLLQSADLERVFRFGHILISQLRSLDAVTHFHLDPTAHDTQTVKILTQLVDVVVELDTDDEWLVDC